MVYIISVKPAKITLKIGAGRLQEVKFNDSPIEYSFENLDRGRGSIVRAKAIYEISIKHPHNIVASSEEAKHLFRVLKRDIDNNIADYSRENQVSDGYITIPIKEYNELKDFWLLQNREIDWDGSKQIGTF